MKKLSLVILLSMGSSASNLSYATNINWAGEYRDAVNVESPELLIGKPDTQAGAIQHQAGLDSEVTLSNFNEVVNYDSNLFSSLLGAPEEDIVKGDFVLFECNGTTNLSFESSTLLFDDGANSLSVEHNINNPASTFNIIAFGSIAPSEYMSFFNTESTGCNGEYVYLVFDIDSKVNPLSPNFKVTIHGKTGDSQGSPDPDAMGVIATENVCATDNSGTVSPNLDIHMPSLNYDTLLGKQNIWADLKYKGTNSEGQHIWGLKDFGVNQ